MNNFDFHVPTDIRFGKGQIECLPEELSKYGKRCFLHMEEEVLRKPESMTG